MLKAIEYFILQMAKLRCKLVPPVDDLKKELIKPETDSSSGPLGFQQCYFSLKYQIHQYQHLISLIEQIVVQIL